MQFFLLLNVLPALSSADVTADSAVILWESPKPEGEDIYGFNVQLYGHNYYMSFASPGNRTYIRVERLKQQKKYFVTVVVISKAGKTPPCPIKEFDHMAECLLFSGHLA